MFSSKNLSYLNKLLFYDEANSYNINENLKLISFVLKCLTIWE
jgi:hypothetical protein